MFNKGCKRHDKQTCFWNDEVKQKVNAKKKSLKEWQLHQTRGKRVVCISAKKEAKRAVASGKRQHYTELYENLHYMDGDKCIYVLVKARTENAKVIWNSIYFNIKK